MGKTNLGKVAICPKGEYSATATYEPLDLVGYKGNSFIARTQNTGIEPVDGEKWQKVAGLSNEYELIAEYTISESTVMAIKGLGANLTHMIAVMIFPELTKIGQFGMGAEPYWWNGFVNDPTFIQAVLRVRRVKTGVFVGEICTSRYLPTQTASASNVYWATSGIRTNGGKDYITIFSVYAGDGIPAGTTITIYGIRA